MAHRHLRTPCECPKLGKGAILVALGGPRLTSPALHIARAFCRFFDRSPMLIHVSTVSLTPSAVPERLGITPDTLAGMAVIPAIGDPGREIVRLSAERECGLIVLGLARPERAGLGPVEEVVLREAACPVLLVPPRIREGWGTGGTILLPLDGTPSTSAVVPLATELAERMGAKLELLHIAGTPPPPERGSLVVPMFMDQPQHEWDLWRQEFLSRFCECHWGGKAPVPIHLSVRVGDPAHAILHEAAEHRPDLIVLGWHGLFAELHAATLRNILAGSGWPVLAVRVPASL